METEAQTLNKLKKKAIKGKASDRELRLLVEVYNLHRIKIPKEVMKQVC